MEQRMGRVGQIRVNLGKCFRTFFNEKGWKKIIFGAVISFIVAYVAGDKMFWYQGNTKSGAFAIICACIWIGIFNSIQSICRERAIIKREHRTGLHISSYIIAHMIFEFVICMIQSLITVIWIWLFHSGRIPNQGVFLFPTMEIFISCFLVTYAADILGMAVSAFVKSENSAMTVMPFILIVQLVFSGLFFTLDDNIEWLSYLTLSRWGVSAIGTTADMNSLPSEKTLMEYEIRHKTESDIDLYDLTKRQEYLDDYDFMTEHLTACWLIMLGFTALYGGAAIAALEFVDRDKR